MNMNRIGDLGNAKSPRAMISHLNVNARLSTLAFVLVVSLQFSNYYTCNNLPTVPRAAYGAS
jgi:hypothetical protein